jgi:hypothetical protein
MGEDRSTICAIVRDFLATLLKSVQFAGQGLRLDLREACLLSRPSGGYSVDCAAFMT